MARSLRPGLSDGQIDEIAKPMGISLPAEARRWWGWHDGAFPLAPGRGPAEVGPGRPFLPLKEAVRVSMEIRGIMGGIWNGTLDPDWKHGFISLDGTELPPVIDCGVAFDQPVPVRAFPFQDPQAATRGTRSIGELVQLWIDAIDAGAWRYSRETENWEYHLDKVDDFEVSDLL